MSIDVEKTVQQKRQFIVDFLKAHAIGPLYGEEETFASDPRRHYISGILFPVDESDMDLTTLEDAKAEAEDSESSAERVSVLAGRICPSSVGLMVRLNRQHGRVRIRISYAIYERPGTEERSGKTRQRRPVTVEFVLSGCDSDGAKDRRLPSGPGYARTILRTDQDGRKLTVFVVNDGTIHEGSGSDGSPDQPLFQVGIQVSCSDPGDALQPLNSRLPVGAQMEDRIIELQHRRHKAFAWSFGCASQWSADQSGTCTAAWTTFLPTHETLPLTFDIPGFEDVLSLRTLAFDMELKSSHVIQRLREFAESYEHWVRLLPDANPDAEGMPEAEAVISACNEALTRIRRGIDLIADDPVTREAFVLANRAMLMQSANRSRTCKPGKRGEYDEPYRSVPQDSFLWRPFQLAFLLLSLEPACDPRSAYRSVVDLIWFPTGGGKTEAYLGLSAFTIFLERLRDPDAARGTSIISRYTLRLLTAQQFERSAALVCAMELIRAEHPGRLGKQPISLGLWLGGDMTPNKVQGTADYPGAAELLDELLQSPNPREENPFKLSNCPVCLHPLLPAHRDEESSVYGFEIEGLRLLIRCTDTHCPLHAGMPISVVDEQIYEELPTIVIGTIDKFARLAWLEEAGWLLNGRGGRFPPPSLIIQDELHLISGPLGSLAGVYETAIEALCSTGGARPHMVASTATVRRADEQTMALYGRHVCQFPPPGLDESDSFFARAKKDAPGRIYVGILAPHETPTTTAVRLHAILLQAHAEAAALGLSSPDDAYATLVSYFNSTRELGQATTLAADDIPDRLKVIQPDRTRRRRLESGDFTDLYSERRGAELSDILNRLEKPAGDARMLSLLLTTNIISVGVSIDRLGLMLVNGQPKTTSEYIQATSRVGRHREMPGLVVTSYSATKPRDRSHFEQFLRYHSRLYASVEPSSVTPFSKPTRDRALHAIIVILARHLPNGIPANADASRIKEHPELVSRIRKIILERVKSASPEEVRGAERDLELRFDQWCQWSDTTPFRYQSNTRQIAALLNRQFGESGSPEGWPTMDSMRNVDFETGIMIVDKRMG